MDEVLQVDGTCMTVFVPKELNHHNAEGIIREADRVLERENIHQIVFDFRDTEFMDSSGIGVIMGRYHNINLVGGYVSAVHVNERINKLLHLSGVYKLITISKEQGWSDKGNKKGEYYGKHQ